MIRHRGDLEYPKAVRRFTRLKPSSPGDTVVLTGDVHNNWANNLKANFYDPGSKTLGVEFVGTSITSGGDGADTSAGNEAVVDEIPHIEFFNGQRGYVRCTLTPRSIVRTTG